MTAMKRTALAALFAFVAAFLVAGAAMGGGNEHPSRHAGPRLSSTELAGLPALADDPAARRRARARRAARRARRLAAERRAAATEPAPAETAPAPAESAPAPTTQDTPAAAPAPPPAATPAPPAPTPLPAPPPPPPPQTFDDSG